MESEQSRKELFIGWSSQTGHSLDLAKEFQQLCLSQNIRVNSMETLSNSTHFHPGIWILFISTTGQGAPPYHMRPLWQNLLKKSYKLEKGVQFAIYSVGDRSYGDNFALAARKLRQRLKMLGAQEIVEIGLGDEQDGGGYRQIFVKQWAPQLIGVLHKTAMTRNELVLDKNGDNHLNKHNRHNRLRNYTEEGDFQVVSVQQLNNRKGRKVLWVQCSSTNLAPTHGDIIEIYPHNRIEDVIFMLNHFKIVGSKQFSFLGLQLPLEQILTCYANISSTMPYIFFCNPSSHLLKSTNPLHQQKLKQFAEDYEQFDNYILKYKRNIVQFLKDFELQLDINYFLTYIGQIVGRKYSIARIQRGLKTNTSRIFLLVKLVQTNITETRFHKGLCSHELITIGTTRKARIVRSDITPAQIKTKNLILALGTGIAPFIWIIDQLTQVNPPTEGPKNILFFTNSYSDEFYHQKLCPQSSQLSQVLSSTQQGGSRLLDLLYSKIQDLKGSIDDKTRVFYCGPKQLQSGISLIIGKVLGLSVEQVIKKKIMICQNW